MPKKVKLSIHQKMVIQAFAMYLQNHFQSDPIKVQETIIKIHVEQVSTQDITFLGNLRFFSNDVVEINISRSGMGLAILIGVAQLNEIPAYLVKYKRF